jgi:hypothetical protein
LLQDLQKEFKPVGAFQTRLVETIAAGLWRLRRATRAEYGATRLKGLWDRSHELLKDSFLDKLNQSVNPQRRCVQALMEAREEIRRTEKLSEESYQKIRLLVEDPQCNQGDNKNDDEAPEPGIDDGFIQRLEAKTESLRAPVLQVESWLADRAADLFKEGGLPPAEDSEKISRYRIRAQQEIDWAMRTLSLL